MSTGISWVQEGAKHLVPDGKQEAKVHLDLGVVQAVRHRPSADTGHPVVGRPPHIMPRVLLEEEGYEDALEHPQRQRVHRAEDTGVSGTLRTGMQLQAFLLCVYTPLFTLWAAYVNELLPLPVCSRTKAYVRAREENPVT